MVYCGKPSKGCSSCRERKIRCDQREPACGQCEKRQQECPGYRNLVDLMFRDESSHVIKKAKARARKRGVLLEVEPATPPDSVGRRTVTPEPPRSAGLKPLSLRVPATPVPSSPAHTDAWSLDDDSMLMSPESGSWPVTPQMALQYNLAPTCQEHGTAYFLSRYVNEDETVCHQKFDFLRDVWRPSSSVGDREVDGVLASMTAVGLMGLASMTRNHDLGEAARKSYGTALRLTNHALRDPSEAAKDSTMLSVLILGVFEMMAENGQGTMRAFQEHVNGAAALARMRGPSQFTSKAGRRMFSMLCQRVVISCVQRDAVVPDHFVELWAHMANTLDAADPSRVIMPVTFKALRLRHDIKKGALTDPELIIDEVAALDAELEALTTKMPPSWHYRTFKVSQHHPAILGGFCHLYPSLWRATVWNCLRTTRILLLETITAQYHQTTPGVSRHDELAAAVPRKLRKLVHEVAASVPQHLGLVSPDGSIEGSTPGSTPIASVEVRETPSPPTSPLSRSSDSASTTSGVHSPTDRQAPFVRQPPSGLTILDVTGGRGAEDEAERYMLLVSATSTVVWPLFVVGMSTACSDETKEYVVGRLRTLYMETGIRQADSVANLLEERNSTARWLEEEDELPFDHQHDMHYQSPSFHEYHQQSPYINQRAIDDQQEIKYQQWMKETMLGDSPSSGTPLLGLGMMISDGVPSVTTTSTTTRIVPCIVSLGDEQPEHHDDYGLSGGVRELGEVKNDFGMTWL